MVQRHETVRDALLDVLQVVFHFHGPSVQLSIFQGHGNLRRQGLEQAFILSVEHAALFVHHLCDPDNPSLPATHRRTEHGAGPKTRRLIDGGIEAGICVRIRHVEQLSSAYHIPRQAERAWETDLDHLSPLGFLRPELVRRPGRLVHHPPHSRLGPILEQPPQPSETGRLDISVERRHEIWHQRAVSVPVVPGDGLQQDGQVANTVSDRTHVIHAGSQRNDQRQSITGQPTHRDRGQHLGQEVLRGQSRRRPH